jgi:hypothetical protein
MVQDATMHNSYVCGYLGFFVKLGSCSMSHHSEGAAARQHRPLLEVQVSPYSIALTHVETGNTWESMHGNTWESMHDWLAPTASCVLVLFCCATELFLFSPAIPKGPAAAGVIRRVLKQLHGTAVIVRPLPTKMAAQLQPSGFSQQTDLIQLPPSCTAGCGDARAQNRPLQPCCCCDGPTVLSAAPQYVWDTFPAWGPQVEHMLTDDMVLMLHQLPSVLTAEA